jgi:hypothetical protein
VGVGGLVDFGEGVQNGVAVWREGCVVHGMVVYESGCGWIGWFW